MDQPKDAVTTARRTAKPTVPEPPIRTIRHTTMAAVRGRMQYPSTHRLWKKEMLPPSSLELSVMMMEPNQTMTKTFERSETEFVSAAEADPRRSVLGEHRSGYTAI